MAQPIDHRALELSLDRRHEQKRPDTPSSRELARRNLSAPENPQVYAAAMIDGSIVFHKTCSMNAHSLTQEAVRFIRVDLIAARSGLAAYLDAAFKGSPNEGL